MVTYEEFFTLIVGKYYEVDKHQKFFKSLSDSIFIFEDTSWFFLQLIFQYSLIVCPAEGEVVWWF